MDIVKIKEQLKTVFKNFLNNKVNNEDKWITIHPNGEDAKGRPLLLKDGETPREALARAYGVDEAKGQQKLFPTKEFKKTREDFQREEQEQKDIFAQHQKKLETKYRNMEFAGTENPDELQDLSGEDVDFEEWEDKKQSDTKDDGEDFEKETQSAKLSEMLAPKQKKEQRPIKLNYIKQTRDGYALYENPKTKTMYMEKDGKFYDMKYREVNKDFETATKDKQSNEDKSIDKYLTDVSDKGWLYQTKGTKTYSNGTKRVEVEEFGENGGKYDVHFYEGSRRAKSSKSYATKSGMEKAVREHLETAQNKETKALSTKTDLTEKENTYKEVLKRYKENDSKRWSRGLSNAEYYKAWDEAEKAKKELTKARREYAESIMANFEKSDNTYYEDKQNARRERYEELAGQHQSSSDAYAKRGSDMMSVIPFGQPIHGQRDRNYRENAWGKFEKSWKEQEKANYYADKANSVGKAGISSDDANAIAKLAQKYKSGVTSAEKRRIIDRVIDIHKNRELAQSSSLQSDYSNLGFQVERNTDINRLQLKFDGKPSENVRSILKSNGFRWSPREGAWQRQLGANSEGSLSRVVEKLNNINNSLLEGLNTILMQKKYSCEDAQIIKKIDEILNPQ
jgi:hypothetical protein